MRDGRAPDLRPADTFGLGFFTAAQVAEFFGQFNPNGTPDTRWTYRHAGKHGFLHAAARRRPGTRALLFDRAALAAIMAEFQPCPGTPDQTND